MIRKLALTTITLTCAIAAQDDGAASRPTGGAQAEAEAAQAPAAKAPAAQDKVRQLEDRLQRLRAELKMMREVESEGGLPRRIAADLADRSLEIPMAVEAKKNTVARPAPAKERELPLADRPLAATVMHPDEVEDYSGDTLAVVAGQVITNDEFDRHFEYLERFAAEDADEETLRRQAFFELAVAHAAAAIYRPELAAARQRAEQLLRVHQSGAPLLEIAKRTPDSRMPDGDLGFFGRDRFPPLFTAAAFMLEEGETSDIVQSEYGFHIIEKIEVQEADDRRETQVRVVHVFVPFDPELEYVDVATEGILSGMVELRFADQELLEQLTPSGYTNSPN